MAAVLLSGCTSSATPSPSQSTAPTGTTTTTTGSTGTAASPTGSTGSTGSTTDGQSAPTCTNGQLSLSTSQDSAGGIFDYVVIEFVNQSSTPCTVEGYPGAAAYGVTDSHYSINSTRQLTGHVGDQYTAPAPITLAHGATASTILEWVDKPTTGTPTPTACATASAPSASPRPTRRRPPPSAFPPTSAPASSSTP